MNDKGFSQQKGGRTSLTKDEYIPEAINHLPEDKNPSVMVALFNHDTNMDLIYDDEIIIHQLKTSPYFTYYQFYDGPSLYPVYEIYYEGFLYEFEVCSYDLEWKYFKSPQKQISTEVMQEIKKTDNMMAVIMYASDNIQQSYHLQLRILHALFPELIAVADNTTGKFLSSEWVNKAANSLFPPDIDYSTVQPPDDFSFPGNFFSILQT